MGVLSQENSGLPKRRQTYLSVEWTISYNKAVTADIKHVVCRCKYTDDRECSLMYDGYGFPLSAYVNHAKSVSTSVWAEKILWRKVEG
jgi:hypothetical protein